MPALAATVDGRVELVDSRQNAARKQKDFSGVVVWLESGAAGPIEARTAQVVQKGKKFTPHTVAIPVGSSVDFPNFDPIFHNAFSNFAGQPFDVGLYAPGTSQKVRFRREGFVRVFCNIHPFMSALIVVLKSPYFAATDAKGAFRIEGAPPGEYQMKVFHERATPATLGALERKIVVAASGASVPPISISESGYIEVAHKNKHGRDYPPVVEDRALYSGSKK